MRTPYLIIMWMALVLSLVGRFAYADDSVLPDSLITDDSVYEYTFSDFDKAERVMRELRERKKLPDFKLDITEGDLYFNTGHYYQALKFYKRALENDSVRWDDNRLMEQIHRLISCYDCLHNEVKKAHYVDMLLKNAERCGNKEMRSVGLFNMGKMLYYQGNKDKGYEMMRKAAALMEETDYKYKYDNLRYNYNTLIVFQELDGRNEETLETLKALDKVVTEETGGETPMEGLNEKEKKALYAHYAIAFFRLGQPEKAEGYYQKFLSTGKGYDRDEYLIMPFAFDRKMYDEVIRMNSVRERILSEQGDTVNYHMTTIKKSLGRAYRDKGDYKASARYFEELAVLRDSIKNREQKSSALELATLYETHGKDLFIQSQAAEIRMRNALLAFIICIVIVAGLLLWRIILYNRIIKAKNRAMAVTIDDLLVFKEELFQQKKENLMLREKLREAECESRERDKEKVAEVDQADISDRTLFDRMEREIITNKLFLQPDFSRDELIKQVYIPKNKFASLFKQYAKVGFSQYINNLRLDYAARQLREYPGYSVEGIAKSCGIPSSTTFYRLFVGRFGMTPSEYRATGK